MFLKYSRSVQLSPQNLIDCVKTNDTDGCDGGLMTDAYKWISKNGLMAEKDYAYVGPTFGFTWQNFYQSNVSGDSRL